MSARVFVITGPSGVGKGTLISKLLERVPELELSTSATTRSPREGEEEGRDYHFLDRPEFERRVEADEFLESAEYSGHLYGTLRSEVERRLEAGRSVVLEIEVQGARQIRNAMPDAYLIFIAPPRPGVLRERLVERGTDDPEEIEKRLKTAETELEAVGEFDVDIVNDDLQRATSELEKRVGDQLRVESGQ